MAKDGTSSPKTATPRLRFPEFRKAEGWKMVELGQVAEIKLGKMLDREKQTSGHLLPYINNATLRWNEVDVANLPEMYFDDDELERFSLRAGDVVVCEGGEPGRSAVWDGSLPKVKFQKAIHRVRFNVPFQPKLLVLYLETIAGTTSFESLFTGTGIKHLTRETFAKLKVPLLKPAEQKKIAACLTSLDEWIVAQGRQVATLAAHKRGLMQQLFPRESESRPRLRFPEFRKEEDWEETTLKSVGVMKAGTFVSASEIADARTEDSFPCYGGNGLRGYTKSFTHSGKYVLIGRQGALCGNAFLVDGKFHATEHALVVTIADNIDVAWLYYMLGFLNLNQYSIGQAQPGLSVTVLERVSVCIPRDKAEQHRIAACLSGLDARLAAASAKLAALQTHKKGLMQQLFPQAEGA